MEKHAQGRPTAYPACVDAGRPPRRERDPEQRRRTHRGTVNGFGAGMTSSALVLVLTTKFTNGAWISIAAMVAIYLITVAIRRITPPSPAS
jgi:dolichol kinase